MSKQHQNRMRIVTFTLVVAVAATAAQGAATPRHSQEQPDATWTGDLSKVRVLQVGKHAVRQGTEIVLDGTDADAGVDVILEVWAIEDPSAVRIVVNERGTGNWVASGPGVEIGSGRVRVPGVFLGSTYDQGRLFRLRAIVLQAPLQNADLENVDWNRRFEQEIVSDFVDIEVPRRVVRDTSPPALSISTVNRQAIDLLDRMVVPHSATIEGTFHPAHRHQFIYGLINADNTDRWRLVGPAETGDSTWVIRNVILGEPSFPSQRHYRLLAISSESALTPGPIRHNEWRKRAIHASMDVTLFVSQPLAALPGDPDNEVRILGVREVDGRQVVEVEAGLPVRVERLSSLFEVVGATAGSFEGSCVWLLLNVPGTARWHAYGPARIRNERWSVPIGSLPSGLDRRLVMVAITSQRSEVPPVVDFATMSAAASAISETTVIQAQQQSPDEKGFEAVVSVEKIAAVDVSDDGGWLSSASGDIEGWVEELAGGTYIWVAVHQAGTDDWIVLGPAIVNGNQWIVPDVPLRTANASSRLSVVAFTTETLIPTGLTTFDRIVANALSTSSVVHTVSQPGESLSAPDTVLPMEPGTMVTVLVLVLLLGALEYLLGVVSSCAAALGRFARAFLLRFRSAFPFYRNLEFGAGSLLGLLIYAIVAGAIWVYIPIYRHILRDLLDLPTRVAGALALILVVFTGLAGALFDVAQSTIKRQVSRFVTTLMLGLLALSLWCFQSGVYSAYYFDRADPTVAVLLGIAALFVSAVETLGFYYATRLSWPLLAALPLSVVDIGLSVTHRGCGLVEEIAWRIPVRNGARDVDRAQCQRDSRRTPEQDGRVEWQSEEKAPPAPAPEDRIEESLAEEARNPRGGNGVGLRQVLPESPEGTS